MYLHLKLLLIKTIKMQFTAILIVDHPLEVMICASVMTLIPINNDLPTLVTHTNLQQNMATILNKPNPFLLEVIILHQLKLKYSIKLFNKIL